jgi:hypothetical protein
MNFKVWAERLDPDAGMQFIQKAIFEMYASG